MRKIGLAVAMDKEFGLLRGLMSGGRDVSCQGLEFLKEKSAKRTLYWHAAAWEKSVRRLACWS